MELIRIFRINRTEQGGAIGKGEPGNINSSRNNLQAYDYNFNEQEIIVLFDLHSSFPRKMQTYSYHKILTEKEIKS